MNSYNLGDKYSADFDYNGMYRMSLDIHLGWGVPKLEKLYESYVDVGYADKAVELLNCINELKNGEVLNAQMYLEEFQDTIEKEFEIGIDEWNERLLKVAYEDVREVCAKHGLILKDDYSISDDGNNYYEPSTIGFREGEEHQDASIFYFEEDNRVLGTIDFDLENRVFTIDFDNWEIHDMGYYGTAKYKRGGHIDDNGNLQMLKNQSKEFKHHAEELGKAIKKNPKVHAWVVAKAERASSDLSDITHYLDGMSNEDYEQGGSVLGEDTVARIDDPFFADPSAYKEGGKIRPLSAIKSAYRRKLDAVKKLTRFQVVDLLNKTSFAIQNGFAKPLAYGDYMPEMREYLALTLFDADVTDAEKRKYYLEGGMVKKKSASFMDKVKAISERLEGTKVPRKYQKDYGKYYDKSESEIAARKIAGKYVSEQKKK